MVSGSQISDQNRKRGWQKRSEIAFPRVDSPYLKITLVPEGLLDHSALTVGGGFMNDTNFGMLKPTLETKLSTIATRSDKRADIVIQQSADDLDQTQFATERDLT